MTQTETTPISGLTLDSLFRENSDSISSEDDEPPRSRQAVGGDAAIMQAGMMMDRHSRQRRAQRMETCDLGGGVRHM